MYRNSVNTHCCYAFRNIVLPITAKLHLCGSIGTDSQPDIQKVWIIGFFCFENRLDWQFEVRLLLFTLCTFV